MSNTLAANFEVLFFDESIDSYEGKSTPFISDTSYNHQESLKYKALTANQEHASKTGYTYMRFPDELQEVSRVA
jgi:hypothetical protein